MGVIGADAGAFGLGVVCNRADSVIDHRSRRRSRSANELPAFSIAVRQFAGFRVMRCGKFVAEGS